MRVVVMGIISILSMIFEAFMSTLPERSVSPKGIITRVRNERHLIHEAMSHRSRRPTCPAPAPAPLYLPNIIANVRGRRGDLRGERRVMWGTFSGNLSCRILVVQKEAFKAALTSPPGEHRRRGHSLRTRALRARPLAIELPIDFFA
jgi:hypothetical protein